MVDAVACLPMILGKALTQGAAQEGLALNGAIDEVSKCAPGLKATTREALQGGEEWELCFEHFIDLHRAMAEKGVMRSCCGSRKCQRRIFLWKSPTTEPAYFANRETLLFLLEQMTS